MAAHSTANNNGNEATQSPQDMEGESLKQSDLPQEE